MIHDFDTWSASRTETNSLSDLEGSVVAIDASFYLNRLLTQPPSKEPLLAALGGLPFALQGHIERELRKFQDYKITPIFVFNGLQVGDEFDPFQRSLLVRQLVNEAWDLYNQHLAERAVNAFGSSTYARPEIYYNLLISILHKWDIQYQVAPYTAVGQLAYLSSLESRVCDVIAGPSELLLFDVDKIITSFTIDNDHAEFSFVQRRHCMEELGIPSADMFVDACILSGSDFLPPLPPLPPTNTGNGARVAPQSRIRDVISLMRARGDSGNSTCSSLADDASMKRFNYLKRYRKARLAVKHHIHLTEDGKVEPFEADSAPGDIHSFIGQRLPDEVYYYLSKGAINPRFLNEFTAEQISEPCPLDGGDSEPYRKLVREALVPMKSTTLCLLARGLHRYHHHRAFKQKFWFDPELENTIRIVDMASPQDEIRDWHVRENLLNKRPGFKESGPRIHFLLTELKDEAFAAETKIKKNETQLLSTKEEVLANTQWSFLRLRGYIDANHELTKWGQVLEATASKMADSPFEDAPILMIELLRFNILFSDAKLIPYSGAPIRGSEVDKRNCLLLSRLACLGKLKHKAIGFTGPLSRHLLSYNTIISKVQSSLRDLLEMCYLTLLLNGDADREKIDIADISLSLPFYFQNDCSLGIAMKHYLDELVGYEDNLTETVKQGVKDRGPKEWFAHAEDFTGDLARAFEFWDALYAGVQTADKLGLLKALDAAGGGSGSAGSDKDGAASMDAEDIKTWDEIDKWVAERR